jgi:hypothetical protein
MTSCKIFLQSILGFQSPASYVYLPDILLRVSYPALSWWSSFLPTINFFLIDDKEIDGTWRIETNEELDYLIKHNNIINQIRAQRLSWFGHVQRISDDRMVKKIYKWKPITTRLKGRPKSRWNDNVKQDICKMKIKNWTVCVQDRGKWRDVLEKAKTFNI